MGEGRRRSAACALVLAAAAACGGAGPRASVPEPATQVATTVEAGGLDVASATSTSVVGTDAADPSAVAPTAPLTLAPSTVSEGTSVEGTTTSVPVESTKDVSTDEEPGTVPESEPEPEPESAPADAIFDLGLVPEVEIDCGEPAEGTGTVDPSSGADGSWRRIRRDGGLTGRSPLVGDVSCPSVLWAKDLSARISLLELVVDGSDPQGIDLAGTGTFGNRWSVLSEFEVEGRRIDLDGDGWNTVDPTDYGKHRVGNLLEGPELERVSCDSGAFQTGAGGDDPLPCYLQRRDGRAWRTSWTSRPFAGFTNDMSTTGQPLVGDFDLDGEPEVAVLPWYDVHLLDLATGAVEATARYQADVYDPDDSTTGRAYGYFGAHDLGGDGRSEFVVMGDFEMFVSVLGWRDGRLVELWDHQIEAGTTLNRAVHDTGAAPVADLDGDGVAEIVTSVFNEDGDGEWHVVAFDGLTGRVRLDLAGRHLAGLRDVDGDGAVEALVSVTSGPATPEFGAVEVVGLVGDAPAVLWRQVGAGWARLDLPAFPTNVNSRSTWGRRAILGGWDLPVGADVAVRSEAGGGEVLLQFLRWRVDGFEVVGTALGPGLRLRGATPDGRLLAEATYRGPGVTVEADGVGLRLLYDGRMAVGDGPEATRGSLLTGAVVGTLAGTDSPTVVVEGVGGLLHGIRTDADGEPETAWTVAGRGMVSGSDVIVPGNGMASVALADVDGTGDLVVVAAMEGLDGRARLRALDGMGGERWSTTFDIPGSPPIWNVGGIIHWSSGYFRHPGREDVLVGVRRTKMHTDELHLLDGRTGELVWSRSRGGVYTGCDGASPSGAGGAHPAMVDVDGDGLDDVVNTYSSIFAIYDGADGSVLRNRWMTSWCPHEENVFTDGFLKHPLPVVLDGDGVRPGILLGGIDATIARLGLDGDVVWNTPMFGGSPRRTVQVALDLDGDGEREVLSVGHCAGGRSVQAFDAASGRQRWQLGLTAVCGSWEVPTHLVAVDLDGDGREEAFFTHQNVLYALEIEDDELRTAWTATFSPDSWSATLGTLAVGDVDGSGRPRLLVNTSSGHLYVVG